MTASAATKKSSELSVGDAAPDFSLPANGCKTISLKSLKGKSVVLYFYPKDDTPGCTIEAKDFRDYIKDFEKAGAVVLGVSKDSPDSHDKFREKYCLPFDLLSDDGSLCDNYGVWKKKSMYGKTFMGVERSTFLIGKTGKIQNIWRKVKVDGHVKEVLDAVKAL